MLQDVLQYIHHNRLPIASVYGEVLADYGDCGKPPGGLSIFLMDIFPLQDQVADGSPDVRLRDLSPYQLLIQPVFRVSPTVYPHARKCGDPAPEEEFPKRHCQYFFLPEVQDFASDAERRNGRKGKREER